MITSLSMLLAGTILALHVEESEGVSPAEADALIAALSEQIANRHNAEAEVIDTRKIKTITCPSAQRCGIEIVARTGATQVIYLRILGIPSKIRVIAESAGSSRGTATVDLPRKRADWKVAIAALIEPLFPAPPAKQVTTQATAEPPMKPPAPVLTPPPQPIAGEAQPQIAPWIAIGAGAAIGGAGLFVGLKNRALVREGEMSTDPARVEELRGDVSTTGLAANLCFGAAIAAVAGGAIWLILGDS